MIYSELAQEFIHEAISAIRTNGDISVGLNRGLEALLKGFGLERAMIWQVNGDYLTVTHQATAGSKPSPCTRFTAQESVSFILSFLSRSPDGKDVQALELSKSADDETDWKPYLDGFEDISSHLMAEIRCEIFSGFVALQSAEPREWSKEASSTIERVGEFLSVWFNQSHDLSTALMDAMVYKAMASISDVFRTGGDTIYNLAYQSVDAIASLLHYRGFNLYLAEGEQFVNSNTAHVLDLNDTTDHFSTVCKIGRGRILLPEQESLPECFERNAGLILPLTHSDKVLGVFGLWDADTKYGLRPQDREIGLTMAGKLAECIASKH